MGFPEAVGLFFSRYADFGGRSRRSEYWWVVLFNLIVFAVLAGLFFVTGGMKEGGEPTPLGFGIIGVGGLYILATLIPSIALFVRRLHDINQNGWIYLGLVIASLIPFIGFLAGIAQIVIACIPGTVGPNKYGPDPKGGHA